MIFAVICGPVLAAPNPLGPVLAVVIMSTLVGARLP